MPFPRRRARLALAPVLVAAATVAAACSGGGDDTDDVGVDPVEVTATAAPTSAAPAVDPDVFLTDELAADEAILTGLPAESPEVAARPALAIKIDNVDAARPQAGINEADLVYEELVEGGLTRLLAVFHSTDPDVVGPVRSARSTDVPLLMPLAMPLFSWSGSNAAFAELLDVTAVIDVGVDRQPDAYVRRDDRSAPSNLYTSPATLRGFTPESSLSPRPMYDFLPAGESTAPGSRPATGVDVDWGTTQVSFRWDSDLEGWTREQDGTPHVDEQGVIVAPENLVVQIVPYVDTPAVDVNGAPVPEAQIVDGRGEAWIFSGGAVTEGEWFKANVTVASIYLDSAGDRVPTTRGRTWVLLVPAGAATLVP